jgi:hypothetical protein
MSDGEGVNALIGRGADKPARRTVGNPGLI